MSKKVLAIAVAASVVLVGIWYFTVYSSQTKAVHAANTQAAASNVQAASLRSQIAVLQKEKAQLPSATAKLTTLKAALPDTPALDKLVDDINAAAVATGVDWQSVSPTKPASYAGGASQASAAGLTGGMQSVTVAMLVNGAPNQITDFVTKLTAMSRLLDVSSFNLNVIAGGAKATGQITSQVFFVPALGGSTVKP